MSEPREKPISSEIESALEGVNLQEIDLAPRAQGKGERAGPGDAKRALHSGPPKAESKLQKGTVVGVHGDDVIVELGPRVQGVVSSLEFEEEPKVGDVYEFSVRGKDPESDLWILSRKEAMTLAKWQEIQTGDLVKAKVTGQNTGGLELKVGPLPAFMPASLVALRHVEDLSKLIGEALVCEVLEVDVAKKRVLLSRRAVLLREREESRQHTLDTLSSGQVVRGKVARLETFGAFVEIAPGVEGLLHVSNISRKRVDDPSSVLKVGDTVEVQVLEIKEGGKRIGLGMKQLEPNPWDDLAARLAPNTTVQGKVVRITDFGAFVEVEPGVEGLLHVSQLGPQHFRRVSDAVKVGQELAVRVVGVEPERERLSLSRLDERGALIGSEDAVDAETISEVLGQSPSEGLGTNLGSLFKKALKKDQ